MRCALAGADRAAKETVAEVVSRSLAADPLSWKSALLLTMAGYAGADPPAVLLERIALEHPDCGARTRALEALPPGPGHVPLLARAGTSSCWQERAAAVRLSDGPAAGLPWRSERVRRSAPPDDAEPAESR